MAELVEWYRHEAPDYSWPLVAAAELVFRFLAIHPFQDGNGRLGRGLFVLALLQSGDPSLVDVVPCISIDRHIEQHRARYYTVLREVSGGIFDPDPSAYDLQPFVEFLVRITGDALADIDVYRERYEAVQSLSEAALAVLNAFKSSPGSRLAVAQLVQKTDLPRRTIQYSIRQLVDRGLLQRLGRGRSTRYQLVF
jgi:Fic family protein